MAAGMYNISDVYILICVMSLYFYCRNTAVDQIDKGSAEPLPDEQTCWHENYFQNSGRLPDGQTRAADPSKSVVSRNGAGQRALAWFNMPRVDLKTATFSAGYKSRSICNAVLGPLHKRLLFTMIKNADYNGSVDRNPYKFRQYDISEFWLYVNGKRVHIADITLDMDYEKTFFWAIGHTLKGSAYITRTRDYS